MKAATGLVMAVALALPGGAMPALAQAPGSVSDKALWCSAALANLIRLSDVPESKQQAAVSDLMRFEADMQAEGEAAGWTEAQVRDIAKGYDEEVGPQIADYLQWKDPAALRYSLSDCFPNVTF